MGVFSHSYGRRMPSFPVPLMWVALRKHNGRELSRCLFLLGKNGYECFKIAI